jgi:hypothetical protein
MAISTTTLNGTDSVSSSRITINDNFNTIADALNDVLSIIDIATGKINNFGYGSNNDMETEDLIVRGSVGGGINVISGNVTLQNGNAILGSTNYIQIGAGVGSAIYFKKIDKTLGLGTIPTIDLTGTGATGGTGPVGYVAVPRMALPDVLGIQNPQIGAIVNVVNAGGTGCFLAICTESGTTGTWYAIATGASSL